MAVYKLSDLHTDHPVIRVYMGRPQQRVATVLGDGTAGLSDLAQLAGEVASKLRTGGLTDVPVRVKWEGSKDGV